MKKYLFLALGVAALTSCSSDEVTELNQGNEIKFSVVADNDSRAAAVWCNNNIPETFRVWANSGGNAFMVDDPYTKSGDVYASSTVRYWPEEAGVDFYALAYEGDVTYTNNSQPSIVDYTPNTEVGQQQDIIYATTPGATKPATGVVALNFRHALSQIEFMAANANPTIKVVVKNVCVGNAVGQGTFTLPTGSTSINYIDPTHGTTGEVIGDFNQGTWEYPAEMVYSDYTVAVQNGGSIELGETASSLTLSTGDVTTTDDHTLGSVAESMMLIPSGTATTAWDPTTGNLNAGSYLGIEVDIYNIVTLDGESTPRETLVYSGMAYVPVSFNWEQGKRYVYTFNFSAGKDGGYREDGTPVLTDINLNVTVDDFIWGGNTTEEMETE